MSDTTYVQYEDINPDEIDDSILIIPLVSLLAPIAWATGTGIHVPEIDSSYLNCLGRIRDIYRGLFPEFSFNRDIKADKIAENAFGGDRSAILFSGGVDSLTSYLKHKDSNPDFISIWGLPDIPHFEEKYWARMFYDIRYMASLDNRQVYQARTDFLRSINLELLSKDFGVRWFIEVSFGLFMLGLCAPVTAARGINNVIISSSYTEDFNHRGGTGSSPSIDNLISWSDVSIIHDSYELSRQQKLKFLCKEEYRKYLSHLRVCWDSALEVNCGECEKCMRTITGLLIVGIDPNICNFHVDSSTLPRIKDCFLKGRISFSYAQHYMWRDLQNNIPDRIDNDIYGSRAFLTWLKGYDLSQYRKNRLRKLKREVVTLCRCRRTNMPSIRRKLKSYSYIWLARLRIL